ncbi:MAG: ABC transporter permease [Blastochloris viridis]|uniref:ABC transporter permease n=1 Tax=Blastochloris viridis TaxID=1079 RepID=A0A6N4RA08_BLAVI|nr:MAG: ABC transporter permease [Blastochloris viridis]
MGCDALAINPHPRYAARMSTWRVAGLILVGITLLAALLAPWLTPFGPNDLHLYDVLREPGATFLLGTDGLGRDVLTRLLYGARTSLSVGLVAVGLATGLGILIGTAAGMGPRWLDAALMRATDVMLCFPTIFLILAVIAFLTPSLMNVMVVIGATGWMGIARLVRAEVLSLRGRSFVEAATLAGASNRRKALKHILPNALPPVITSMSLGLAGAILTEAGLSYLGLGVQPPTPSWGAMLTEGKAVIEAAWWLITFPGLAIIFAVLGFTLLAESGPKKA